MDDADLWAVRGILYGVAPWDPLSFLAVPDGIAIVALSAALAAPLRAARLDPVWALRER